MNPEKAREENEARRLREGTDDILLGMLVGVAVLERDMEKARVEIEEALVEKDEDKFMYATTMLKRLEAIHAR